MEISDIFCAAGIVDWAKGGVDLVRRLESEGAEEAEIAFVEVGARSSEKLQFVEGHCDVSKP